MKTLYSILLVLWGQCIFAQSEKKGFLPTSAVGLQYAGSTGLISTGYFRQSANNKFEVGLSYGFTPRFAGGVIHSLTLKFNYKPFLIHISPSFQLEPLQTGIFVTQSFGNNLFLTWPDKYDPSYYRWLNSTRFHISLGTQASYVLNTPDVEKISFYFETNTNELYIYSYINNNNWKTLKLTDIFFFGTGSKIYFK